jgi:outer membrane protein assembly factor BamE (lipoprotein component of BamABCDE complex)
VATGMDKTQVIDAAGTPKRTQRINDGDVWTYVYYIGDRHFERDIRFESGHVVTISSAREVPPDAYSDKILKDYEKLVIEKESKTP